MILHILLDRQLECQKCTENPTWLSDLARHKHRFCLSAKFPERYFGLGKKNIIMVWEEMNIWHGAWQVYCEEALENMSKIRVGQKARYRMDALFPLQQTSGDILCYCARNAALNSEVAGPGWHRLWMSLQRRKERRQSETEEEKVKKRGRKKREKK